MLSQTSREAMPDELLKSGEGNLLLWAERFGKRALDVMEQGPLSVGPAARLAGTYLLPFFLSNENSISTRSPHTHTKAGRGVIALILSTAKIEY